MAKDVARAYFNAPSTSSVFVELCEEDRGLENEKNVGRIFSVDVGHAVRS